VIAFWTICVNLFLFAFLKAKGWLRVPAADELAGLDASYHGGSVFDEQTKLVKATTPVQTAHADQRSRVLVEP